MSVKRRTLSLNTLASASAAARRLVSSGSAEQVERRLERERLRLALDLEAQRRHGLVEEPVPGAARGLALLVEQPLELLLELVGLLLAQVVDPRLVARERRHLRAPRQHRFVDLVELELEEDEIGRDGGQLLRMSP